MRKFASIVLVISFHCATLASDDSAKPYFSWDTVPVYIHFGKSSGPLSETELRFVAQVLSVLRKAMGGVVSAPQKKELPSTPNGSRNSIQE
jgi:hypothetical protein